MSSQKIHFHYHKPPKKRRRKKYKEVKFKKWYRNWLQNKYWNWVRTTSVAKFVANMPWMPLFAPTQNARSFSAIPAWTAPNQIYKTNVLFAAISPSATSQVHTQLPLIPWSCYVHYVRRNISLSKSKSITNLIANISIGCSADTASKKYKRKK